MIVCDGGPPTTNFAGGATVARAARAELGAGRGRDAVLERKNGEGREERSCWGLKTGEARARGGHGRHPAGVAGMRSPRGAACLTRTDASARGGRRRRAGVAWAAEARLGRGRGAGTGEEDWAGFGQRTEREAASR
jgi:hypothetical protein